VALFTKMLSENTSFV